MEVFRVVNLRGVSVADRYYQLITPWSVASSPSYLGKNRRMFERFLARGGSSMNSIWDSKASMSLSLDLCLGLGKTGGSDNNISIHQYLQISPPSCWLCKRLGRNVATSENLISDREIAMKMGCTIRLAPIASLFCDRREYTTPWRQLCERSHEQPQSAASRETWHVICHVCRPQIRIVSLAFHPLASSFLQRSRIQRRFYCGIFHLAVTLKQPASCSLAMTVWVGALQYRPL